MTETDTSIDATDDAGVRGQALAIVVALTVIIAVVVLTFAFSTHNTSISVDGDKAEFSHSLDD